MALPRCSPRCGPSEKDILATPVALEFAPIWDSCGSDHGEFFRPRRDNDQPSPMTKKREKISYSVRSVAELTDTSVISIKYYEKVGLIPRPDHTERGHRRYYDDDKERLIFIRHCRRLGFSIENIRALVVALQLRDASDTAENIAQDQLAETRAKLAELRSREEDLVGFLSYWRAAWAAEEGFDCWSWNISAEKPKKSFVLGRGKVSSPSAITGQRRS
jgi:DNA-binding transcriptional MerR regulator